MRSTRLLRGRTAPLLTVATAVLAGFGGTAYASASLTVKVSNGGGLTGAAAMVTLTDTRTDVRWACITKGSTSASQLSGTLTNGTHTGSPPVKIGTVSGWAFHGCSGPFATLAISIKSLPYPLQVDSTTNSNGDTDVIISGINMSIVEVGCDFNLTGSTAGFYTNSNHTTTLTPTLPIKPLSKAQLTVSNVSGCVGLLKNGDHMTIQATYPLSIHAQVSSA